MSQFDNLIDDLSSGNLFDSSPIAEPVAELLPHRNQPYEIGNDNPILKFTQPNESRYTPTVSDSELDYMVELDVDLSLAKMDMFMELGKGGISEFLVTKEDIAILTNYQNGERSQPIEVINEIIERVNIKKEFENNKPENRQQERELLKKVIKNDLLKRQANGTLKLPELSEMVNKMFINRLVFLSGKSPQVFTVIGKNLINRALKLIS